MAEARVRAVDVRHVAARVGRAHVGGRALPGRAREPVLVEHVRGRERGCLIARVAARGALALCSLLVTPFLYDYDLAVLAVPLAWVTASAQKTGWRSWEKLVASSLFLLPLFLRACGMGLGLTLAPPFLLALLFVIARRATLPVPARTALRVAA